MSMFSLITLFAGTMAWFTSVRKAHNAADDFAVENTSLMITSFKVYNQADNNSPYVFKSTPAVSYSVNGENVTQTASNEAISIRAYSSLSEKPDSTLLYLFEVDTNRANTPQDGFSIKIKTDTADSSNAGANGTNGCLVHKENNGSVSHQLVYDVDAATKTAMQNEYYQKTGQQLSDDYFGHNSMSSIVSFDAKGISSLTATNNRYNLSSEFASTSSNSFVHSIQSDTNGDITYQYTQNLDMFTRTSNSGNCPDYVAIVCHYNPLSLQYIFNINLGNQVADSEIVYFKCDWYFEIR